MVGWRCGKCGVQFFINTMQIVFVTCPCADAPNLLRQLVEERLAAGGNIIPTVRSIYRWKGEIYDTPESAILLETSDAQVEAMMQRICELHPYEVPKIVTFDPKEKLQDFLCWVDDQTSNHS